MADRALALKTLHFLTIGEVMAKARIRIPRFSALKDGVNRICAGRFADNRKIIYLPTTLLLYFNESTGNYRPDSNLH
ncbi:hypothetical protein PJIAN_3123 [Paludibacter jiangxiensis]|uniref:Uncharacterized protein n=1 Tax=Paludibacter jiangxiensis TaxID=681398 RepID=A0A170ZM55_9BACT|nr:hypothetical protein PJIAN_3123 [Paludibacter jiangxiensis]